MKQRSKSTLFLIEQLIVVAVFAICAAACTTIFVTSYFYMNDSKAISQALVRAESAAEIFKATRGDLSAVVFYTSEAFVFVDPSPETSVAMVFYDKSWQPCSIDYAAYYLTVIIDARDGTGDSKIISGEVTVRKATGEILVSFPVATREPPVYIQETGGAG